MAEEREKQSKKYSGEGSELEMNLTPMIDVVFLLITFFMVVTVIVSNEVTVLYLPSVVVEADTSQDPDRFILNITREGFVYLRGERLDKVTVKQRLRREANKSPIKGTRFSDQKILIRADRDAMYDFVQMVLIKCTEVGILNIQFGVKQDKES